MKTTITFHTDSAAKINLLLKLAHEMGVTTSADDALQKEDREWLRLSEQSLAKEWLSPEEDIWDNFIKGKLK